MKITDAQLIVYSGIILLSLLFWRYILELETFAQGFQPNKIIGSVLTAYAIFALGEKWATYCKNLGLARTAPHMRFILMITSFALLSMLLGAVVCSLIEFQNVIISGTVTLIFLVFFKRVFQDTFELISNTYLIERDPEVLMLNSVIGDSY